MSISIALVTGAAHRLGRIFALSLAKQGYSILLHYNTSEKDALETAAIIRELGVMVRTRKADLSKPDQITSLFSTLDEFLGTGSSEKSAFKILVNSAAIMRTGNPHDLKVEEWNAIFDINLRAAFFCAQESAQRMRAGGLIVNISDIGAQKPWSRFPAYSISKAGLEAMTRVLARAYAPGIRVNAIAPGLVLPTGEVTAEKWERLVMRLPLKRAAKDEELAAALEYLVRNEYVTGQTIVVDGGYGLVG